MHFAEISGIMPLDDARDFYVLSASLLALRIICRGNFPKIDPAGTADKRFRAADRKYLLIENLKSRSKEFEDG